MTTPALTFPGIPGEWADPLPPATPIVVNGALAGVLYSGACVLMGWSVRNTSAAADFVLFYDGGDSRGTLVGQSRTAAGNTDTERCGHNGVLCKGGLAYTQGTGVIVGTVYIVPL